VGALQADSTIEASARLVSCYLYSIFYNHTHFYVYSCQAKR